jgi:hypothetical protein
MEPLVLYHGSHGWSGETALRPSSGKPSGTANSRAEHGPGLYLTTALTTAQKYARGGGRTLRFVLDPSLTWMEDGATIGLKNMIAFLRSVPRVPKRDAIIGDLEYYERRTGRDQLPASVLVNLMVNHEALGGARGPALADFLVRHGIDASDAKYSGGAGDEDWVVLFNLEKILEWGPVPKNAPWNLPPVRGWRRRWP